MSKTVVGHLATFIASILLTYPGTLFAQQQAPLQFEVASIRPGNPKLGEYSSTSGGVSGGSFRMVNVPLTQWLEMGLGVKGYALEAPSWVEKSRFDLDAKFPADKPVDARARAEMIKTLLIERFGLKWHEQSQSVAGYELVPDKKLLIERSGLLERLRGPGLGSGPSFINGTDMPMSVLVGAMAEVLGRPVVDATHLAGGFDLKLIWRPTDDAVAAEEKRHGIDVDNLPASIFEAVRMQLGLRLQSAKVPSKVIVVDSISRLPTGN